MAEGSIHLNMCETITIYGCVVQVATQYLLPGKIPDVLMWGRFSLIRGTEIPVLDMKKL